TTQQTLIDLLTDQELKRMETFRRTWGHPDALRVQAEAESQHIKRLRALLGDEKFALYRDYDDTRAARRQVTWLDASFRGANKLRSEQRAQLIEVLTDVDRYPVESTRAALSPRARLVRAEDPERIYVVGELAHAE